MKCSKCNKEWAEGAKFCGDCGMKLPEIVTATVTQAMPSAAKRPEGRSQPEASPVLPGKGDWIPGQELLDDFVVERIFGEGGMGKVYLLRSRSTGSRFAVKRAKGMKEADRRNFLAELQTWIDLPEHANLVPCRFFRSMGDETLIFAEYVEGGSLSQWIQSRKLYEGGPKAALERMLDAAMADLKRALAWLQQQLAKHSA